MDISVFYLQFLVYVANACKIEDHESEDYQKLTGKKTLTWPKLASKVVMMENNQMQPRKALDKFKMPNCSIGNDIYSLAYASFLDPDQLEERQGIPGLPKIEMDGDEMQQIYLGAVVIIMI